MKYTIELTDGQKRQMDLLIEMAHKHVGFTPKLEMNIPLPMKESPAYKKGFEDGAKAQNEVQYSKALEDGYKGYKYLEQWFNDTCFYDDEDNLFPEYKRRQADTCCLEDIITDVGFFEVLNRVKAHEEKEKAKKIKIGDEMEYLPTQTIFCVLGESPQRYKGFYKAETNIYMPITFCDFEKHNCKPTGRHFEEITQLLDKLRVEEE